MAIITISEWKNWNLRIYWKCYSFLFTLVLNIDLPLYLLQVQSTLFDKRIKDMLKIFVNFNKSDLIIFFL